MIRDVLYDSLHFLDIGGAASGFATIVTLNALSRKPPFARIPLLTMSTVIGLGCGYWIRQTMDRWALERDMVIQDYIGRHPEHFPELEKKKYKDILQEWHPIR